MREYANKPESQSRTLDNNPRAPRQAPIADILQVYKNGTLGRQPVQRESMENNELLQDKILRQAPTSAIFQRYVPEDDDELLQGKFEAAQREEMDENELLQGKFESDTQTEQEPVQREEKPNNTGLPGNLKASIENLSGYSMDDIRVKHNSDKPAQLNALAYVQGTDIHVASGQKQHLPHEAWHVVQQKQGRVQPTMQLQGVNVDDNKGLEREADVMGGSALQLNNDNQTKKEENINTKVTQMYIRNRNYVLSSPINAALGQGMAINEKEPATIYLEPRTPIPPEFAQLGIVIFGNGTAGTPVANYFRYIQGPPPNHTLKENFDDNPVDYPKENANRKERAEDRLMYQIMILKKVKNIIAKLINNSNAKSGIRSFIKEYLKEDKKEWKKKTIFALGKDFLFDVYAIRGIKNNTTLQPNEKQILWEHIAQDINFRLAQVRQELRLIDYVPQVKTDCDTSVGSRNTLLATPNEWEKADMRSPQGEDSRGDYRGEFKINWAYHYATKINIPNSNDKLFIEDAAGKSSDRDEKANAHWFANIYGNENNTYNIPNALTAPANLPCNFNNLNLNSRKSILESIFDVQDHNLDPHLQKTWSMYYKDQHHRLLSNSGHITISINNFKFQYQFHNFQPTDYVKTDFLLRTAIAIMDDVVIKNYSKNIFANLNIRAISTDSIETL